MFCGADRGYLAGVRVAQRDGFACVQADVKAASTEKPRPRRIPIPMAVDMSPGN
jgi:hypothetical protein